MVKIWALIIVFLLVGAMALPFTSAKKEKITIYYQIQADEEMVLLQQVFPKAEEALGIDIKGRNLDNLDTIDKVTASVRSGKQGSVNIVLTDIAYIGIWYSGNTYLDLASRFDEWTDKPEFFEPVLNAGIINDKVVALPLRTDCEVLYYNEEMFNKYGVSTPDTWKSWDDLYSAAKTFKDATGSAKFGMKGDLYEGLTCDVLSYVWAAGGNVLDPQRNVCFNSKGTIDAFSFLQKMWNEGLIHQNSKIWKEGSIVEEGMLSNQIYVALDWPYAMGMLQEAGKKGWKVALTPPGPETRSTALGSWYFVVPKNAPNQDTTWELIKYLLGDEMQLLMNEKLGWSMANTNTWKISENWAQWRKDLVNTQREMISKYAHPRPQIAKWVKVSFLIQKCFDKVVYRGEDAAKVVEATANEIKNMV